MENKLTKEQAIQILEQATGQLKLTRQEHQLIAQALQVLAESAKKDV